MSALSKLQSQSNTHDNGIELKELWQVIVRRRLLIVGIASVIFLISIFYAYLSTNIYSTYASIEIEIKDGNGRVFSPSEQVDIFLGEIGGVSKIDNEVEMLRSRELLLKLMTIMPLNVRYFQKGVLKDTEIYNSRPFDFKLRDVSTSFNQAVVFDIKIIDKNLYHIKAVSSDNSALQWSMDGEFRFGQTLKTPYFTFILEPTKRFSTNNDSYKISYQPNKDSFIDGFIRSNLSVAQISKQSSIVKITFEDNTPDRGVDIVNNIVKLYFQEKLDSQKEDVEKKLIFINEQLANMHDVLFKSQTGVKDFKQANTIATIPDSAYVLFTTLVGIDTQIAQTDMKLNVVKGLINSQNTTSISVDAVGLSNSSTANMISVLQQKSAEREALLAEYTPKHPDVVKLSNEIRTLETSIRDSMVSFYNSLKKQKNDLAATKKTYEGSLGNIPGKESGLMSLNRNFQVNEKKYLYLLEKKAEFEIMNAAKISKNKILDKAIMYPNPIKPKKSFIAIVGLTLGLIWGIFIAFILEFYNNKIVTTKDVKRITDIPMYGAVPENKGKESVFAESLNTIRVNLEFVSSQNSGKVIMIGSNIPEEGKTTIIVNLAHILAKADKKVVLLDLNMRKSKLSEDFLDDGTSSILIGKATIDDVIIHVEKNMDIIFAGKNPPNPSELLLSSGIEKILNELKNSYDYVIINTTPVSLATDTIILLKKHIHDIFLLVIRSGFTDKSLLDNFSKMMRKHQIPSVGIILNGIEIADGSYCDYSYDYRAETKSE